MADEELTHDKLPRPAEQRRWRSAAQAYMGVAGFKTLGDFGMAKTREQIADVNHKADEAAAAGKRS